MDEKEWTIALYHGGEFQDIPHKSYVGGEVAYFDHISYDYMSLPVFWEMAEKLKKYPEPRMCKFYYRLPRFPFKVDLRAIESDADVLKMLECHMKFSIITAFLVEPQPEPLDQLEPPLALDQKANDEVKQPSRTVENVDGVGSSSRGGRKGRGSRGGRSGRGVGSSSKTGS